MSKMYKQAIADAKAVRETAIANAKIALEEAFTPRLQSLLSKKLQSEMEGDEDEFELDELDSSDIADGGEPSADASHAHTELDPETDEETAAVGEEDDHAEVVAEEDEFELEEEEDEFDLDEEYEDEDDLELESIIRELEDEMEEGEYEEAYENAGVGFDDPTNADDADLDLDEILREMEMEDELEEEDEFDLDEILREIEDEDELEEEDEFDLDEILREMDYEDDLEEEEDFDLDEILREMEHDDELEEGDYEDEVDESEEIEALEDELEEARSVIRSLRNTINEVNLLNAKLLYTNKLFRSYALNNEQKTKVVENLDRTSSVREVKLVYATLAESMKMGGTNKRFRGITEGISSATRSTAPTKKVITESSDVLADRFKKLAGIVKG